MHKTRRATVATLAALTLATSALTACNRTSAPNTCDALSLALTGNVKPKAPAPAKAPKVTVKEPKRGSGGTIVVDSDPDPVIFADDDDGCDDD